jgi:arylsulfatase A-like enzyme
LNVRRRTGPVRARAVACSAAALVAAACGADRSPVVVLVTLDTTRADALGVYGHPEARTPTLDAWARSGALVRWAVADVPLTLPSHATLMTAVPAAGHGVRTNVAFRLGDGAYTLAERFSDAGFRTEAVVSTLVLREETGIAQGFAVYDDALGTPSVPVDPARYPPLDPGPPTVRRAEEAVDHALALLGDPDGPTFLWLHLFDAHAVYDPPRPWELAAPDLYHAEIAAMDAELRRLARRLDGADLRDRAVLAVTADHGEGLEDHREEEHGLFVYDEAVLVPLLVSGPGVPRVLLDDQARTIDVAPTLLELAGLDGALGLGGSLLPALAGRGPVPDPVAYCESMRPRLSHGASALKGWRTRDAKFIWAPEPERYDLTADPGELRNVATAAGVPRDRDRLSDLMESVRDATEPCALPAGELDEDTEARLESLGYTGRRPDVPGRLPPAAELSVAGYDPKWIVDVAMAGRDLEVGLPEAARRKLLRFLATAPDPETRPDLRPLWSSAHADLALLALQEGDAAGAAREYRRALALDPENAAAREGRVRALLEGGSFREALEEADAMLALRPGETRLRVFRALALALTGRLAESRAAFVELDRESYPPDVRQTAAYCRARLDAGDPSGLRSLLAIR